MPQQENVYLGSELMAAIAASQYQSNLVLRGVDDTGKRDSMVYYVSGNSLDPGKVFANIKQSDVVSFCEILQCLIDESDPDNDIDIRANPGHQIDGVQLHPGAFSDEIWMAAMEAWNPEEEEEEECAYCGCTVIHRDEISTEDDETWKSISEEHHPWCDWVITRAHRVFEK